MDQPGDEIRHLEVTLGAYSRLDDHRENQRQSREMVRRAHAPKVDQVNR